MSGDPERQAALRCFWCSRASESGESRFGYSWHCHGSGGPELLELEMYRIHSSSFCGMPVQSET